MAHRAEDLMKIAIVHYHLSPGGVTTVIRRASETLAALSIPHVILSSSEIDDLPARSVAGLAYRKDSGQLTAEQLLNELRDEAESALGAPPDIWHFHNHSLGKNTLLPEVVDRLVRNNQRVVLQIHDLAEDGRPQNYSNIPDKSLLYPVSPNVRYAFINPRDQRLFIEAGLPPENAIHLPNPPPKSSPLPPSAPPTPLLLYPSRAIRRKNIGELLLLSLLAPEGTRFAITRAPENPEALIIHNRWRAFSEKHQMPVGFEVVDRISPDAATDKSFASWLSAATHLVSTSVSEGHGLVFDEAAAFARPLIGRNLGWTSSPDLYDRILVPKSWIAPKVLDLHFTASVIETHRLYGRGLIPHDFPFADDLLDFGNLPEAIQKQVLLQLIRDPSADFLVESAGKKIHARSWLKQRISSGSAPIIRPSSTTNLVDLYRSLQGSEARESFGGERSVPHESGVLTADVRLPQPNLSQDSLHHLDPDAVLDRYLTPERFHFLLTSPPRIRAVIFDIYGTLIISPAAGIKPDPAFDPVLEEMLRAAGFAPPPQPTVALHEAVLRHHAASTEQHPEIDLLRIWDEVLGSPPPRELIQGIEDRWHPVSEMPGASEAIENLHASGIRIGLLSNAQFNTLPALDRIVPTHLIDPALVVLSYQHRIAKPSLRLFQMVASRLAMEGIAPDEILFVGNDPKQDINPASTTGFRTALFTGHPDSLRPGDCRSDAVINSLSEIPKLIHNL